jgi:hypothetical protein
MPGCSLGVALTTLSHLAPRLKKEYSYLSAPSLGLHGLFWGELSLSELLDAYQQPGTRMERPFLWSVMNRD